MLSENTVVFMVAFIVSWFPLLKPDSFWQLFGRNQIEKPEGWNTFSYILGMTALISSLIGLFISQIFGVVV